MSDTRMPTQKRSIEKRNKIIKKGFELMCEKGYYNTNTTEIAEYADVSTGIIYQYFNDKKEIFIEGIKEYSNNIMFPMIDILNNKNIIINDLDKLLDKMIEKFIETHTLSKKAHEEMIAMSHLDNDISEIFNKREIETTEQIVTILNKNNIITENLYEKVHIIIGIVENLCHEIVYHNHKKLNYDIMKKEVIKIILNILNNQ